MDARHIVNVDPFLLHPAACHPAVDGFRVFPEFLLAFKEGNLQLQRRIGIGTHLGKVKGKVSHEMIAEIIQHRIALLQQPVAFDNGLLFQQLRPEFFRFFQEICILHNPIALSVSFAFIIAQAGLFSSTFPCPPFRKDCACIPIPLPLQ